MQISRLPLRGAYRLHAPWFVLLLSLTAPVRADHESGSNTSEKVLREHAVSANLDFITPPFKGSHLYVPKDGNSKHAGVIVLHGSEGGRVNGADFIAMHFAREAGYAAMALDYFHAPGLSTDLDSIPVEYVVKAAKWMMRNSYAIKKPALIGYSRGAEFAILVGSLDRGRTFSAIAVHSTHSTTWPALHFVGDNVEGGYDAAWSYRGKDIPPFLLIDLWRFPGPVLLSHGKKDDVWSYTESTSLLDAARRHGKKNVLLLLHANEGHGLSIAASHRFYRQAIKLLRKPTGAP